MRAHVPWKPVLVLALLAAALPAFPQDTQTESGEEQEKQEKEEEKEEGLGTVVVSVDAWFAQPTGLEYQPATQADPTNPFGTHLLDLNHGTADRFRWQAGYEFHDNIGTILFTYYSHKDVSERSWFEPGQFIFGELAVTPFLAGVFYDGMADGTLAQARTGTRDLRLDFYRDAFTGNRISAKWFVGYLRAIHRRDLNATYFALAPNLPPLIPPLTAPRPDLIPQPDAASIASSYNGRGIEAGLDLTLSVRGKRAWIETGFAVGVLRGRMESHYASRTHFYALVDGDTIEAVFDPPFTEFEFADPSNPSQPIINRARQIAVVTGLHTTGDSSSAQVLETYLGFRWKFWKTLEAAAGFRSIRYSNVGADIRPGSFELQSDLTLDEFTLDGFALVRLNPVTLERTEHSVDYEGYYIGLSYRY